jgi:flagellar hook-length control protein FliK
MSPGVTTAVSTPVHTDAPAPSPGSGATQQGAAAAGAASTTSAPGARPPTPGSSPPTERFASVLSSHVARTALAEGQEKQALKPAGRRPDRAVKVNADPAPVSALTPAAGQPDAPAAIEAALMNPAVMATGLGARPATGGQATGSAGTGPSANVATGPSANVATAMATAAASSSALVGAGDAKLSVPTTLTARPVATPAATLPATPAEATAEATAQTPAAVLTPATPRPPAGGRRDAQRQSLDRSTSTHVGVRSARLPGRDSAGAAPATTVRSGAAPSIATGAAIPGGPRAATGAGASGTTAGATPAAAAGGAQATGRTATTAARLPAGPPSANGVRLAQAAEAVHNSIALGTRSGVSVARIQLAPASLGGLQIHLQHTSEGIIARVVADHPDAARALAQSGDDLRRSLQSSGQTLLRLDIESSNQGGSSPQDQPAASGGPGGFRGQHPDHSGQPEVADTVSAEVPIHSVSSAALVNVLA